MKTYLRLLKYLKPYIWPYFALGLLCMIGFGATDGVLPFLIQRIMDDVFAAKNQSTLFYIPRDEDDGVGLWASLTTVNEALTSCFTISYVSANVGSSWGSYIYFGGPGANTCN